MPRHNHIPHIYKPLYPFAWLYSAGVWLRNKLFDKGLLPVEEFSVPIISVGNLTVGGTGKTPLIEYLIEFISPQARVAVLSRGYRRKSRGFVIATPTTKVQEIGDEPYQIYSKYPHISVAVDSNRRRGIKQLLQLDPAPEIILLDDAHQHRYVRPSLSIVLCDYNRPIYSDLPLPAGRLREPIGGLQRADVVLLTKCNHILSREELNKEATLLQYDADKLYASHIEYGDLRALSTDSTHRITELIKPHTSVILLSGIANSAPMLHYIETFTKDIHHYNFPDHYNYTFDEIELITRRAKERNCIIITTEKDAARLNGLRLPDNFRQYYYILPLSVKIQQENNSFDNLIAETICQR